MGVKCTFSSNCRLYAAKKNEIKCSKFGMINCSKFGMVAHRLACSICSG